MGLNSWAETKIACVPIRLWAPSFAGSTETKGKHLDFLLKKKKKKITLIDDMDGNSRNVTENTAEVNL